MAQVLKPTIASRWMSRSTSFIRLAVPSLSRLGVPVLLLLVHLAAPANAMEECDAPLKVLVTGTLLPTPTSCPPPSETFDQTWTIPPAAALFSVHVLGLSPACALPQNALV